MPSIDSNISDIRKALAKKHLKAFAKTYFTHYFKTSAANFHDELFDILNSMALKRDERFALVAPRGYAKSTIVSLIFPLWGMCYGRDRHIVLLSATHRQAESQLLEPIRNELRHNKLLIMDFPEACEPPGIKWTRSEIITKSNVRVIANGVGQEIRGTRVNQHRPSLVISDDIETLENTQTSEGRQKLFDWYTKSILQLGDKETNFIVAGNIRHYDSLLARLTNEDYFPGWEFRKYKAIISWADRADLWEKWQLIFRKKETYKDRKGSDAALVFFKEYGQEMLRGTEVLWASKESYLDLMIEREKVSRASFDSEKQNDPVDISSSQFPRQEIHFWTRSYRNVQELLAYLQNHYAVFASCDPSTGANNHSDFSAVIVGLKDLRHDGSIYIVEAEIGRWKMDELIDRIIALYAKWRFSRFGFESNGFQHNIANLVRERGKTKGAFIPVDLVKNTTAKEARILPLQPLVKCGDIKFAGYHETLIEQLERYPKGHDDGPDALATLVKLAEDGCMDEMIQILTQPFRLGSQGDKKIIGVENFHNKKWLNDSGIDPFDFLQG